MNPDFAIILNFKLKSTKDVDVDFLVKTARDVGVRAVATDALQASFQKACAKYTIALTKSQDGLDLKADNVINQMVKKRKNGEQIFINVQVKTDGSLNEVMQKMLDQINNWMHIYGHAFNESEPCKLSAQPDSFVLQNRHMNYQKYVFVKKPLPQQVEISGFNTAPNRVEMIEKRIEPAFDYDNGKVTIDLSKIKSDFEWQVVRIQEHRPEDDLIETKF